jgi:uncharacterized protein (DUF2236 family)
MALQSFFAPPGATRVDFAAPVGAPALFAPDSIAWQVHKNPVTLFVGGVAAVLLELAEPRVRTGVWEHSTFRSDPAGRMRRTGHAAMVTVYAPRASAEALIARVRAMHAQVYGVTPAGVRYRADDPELLDWVHATASFGLLRAFDRFARPLRADERDSYFAHGIGARWGASGAPRSEADWERLLRETMPRLEPHPIVQEFLRLVTCTRVGPAPRAMQRLLVRSAVSILPAPVRELLGIEPRWTLSAVQASVVRALAVGADRTVLRNAPPAQACLRLGLPADWLYRR